MEYDVSLQTIAWINELNNNGLLEINPSFQRRAVWEEEERSQLMNTIFSNLPFPEVYYQIETEPDTGKQRYIVVDGQQRTTSLLMFINNEYSLPETGTFGGFYFKDLDKISKENFWNYKIVVRFLKRTNDVEIRSLFEKLNTNNIKLNDQELRNARYTGKFKTLSEKFADSSFFQSISLFTTKEIRRMNDIEYVSELLLQQIYGVTNKKDLLESAYSKFNKDLPNETEFEEEFTIVLNLIRTIISDSNKQLIKTKTSFYSLFGAVLQFYRETKLTHFTDPKNIETSITDLLHNVRDEGEFSDNSDVKNYAQAYSRAASDKSRRIKRQEILRKFLS